VLCAYRRASATNLPDLSVTGWHNGENVVRPARLSPCSFAPLIFISFAFIEIQRNLSESGDILIIAGTLLRPLYARMFIFPTKRNKRNELRRNEDGGEG